ncbi:MAG: prolipoprotein diacylglyceryl transferase [Clostridia bacterium]|nr:prolipoprotein diacylglyceryl transferase [Clostridia bacterium]
MTNIVKFPNLGIQFTIDRVMFSIGGIKIYWYGFIIALAFLLAVWYGLRRCEKFGIDKDTIVDMLLIVTPIAIIGARAYYVLFNFSEFEGDFWSVFEIWNGGIAIYGAVIFSVISALIFCKIKKLNTLNLFDLGALGLMIGQSIGRWGNFVNGEAYGIAVDGLPWGMVVENQIHSTFGVMVHPIFLYESLWNALGLLILHFVSKKRRFYGQIFFSYIAWYGIGRGFVEGIRGDDALLFFDTGIKVSQVLGYLSALVAIGIIVYKFIFSDRGDTIELLTKEEIAQAKLAAVAEGAAEETVEVAPAEVACECEEAAEEITEETVEETKEEETL